MKRVLSTRSRNGARGVELGAIKLVSRNRYEPKVLWLAASASPL